MSEPVSNAEIEDVLSSIRRLVSENNDTTSLVSSRIESAEKLVLTPAFRVLDGDGGADAPTTNSGADFAAHSDMANVVDKQPEPATKSETVVEMVDETSEMPEISDVGSDDLGDKIAALEAAISDRHEDWEPDGSEQDIVDADPIVIQRATPAHVVELQQPEMGNQPDHPAQPDAPTDAETVDTQNDIKDFMGTSDDILAEDTDDTAFLDEEMLRELVTELVREELRGHIGERITRNVRRLVRREIKRALAVHDLQ